MENEEEGKEKKEWKEENEKNMRRRYRRNRRRRRRVRGWHNIGTRAARRKSKAVSMLNYGWSIKLTAHLHLLPGQ